MSEIWGAYFQEGLFSEGRIVGILWYIIFLNWIVQN